MCAYFYVDDDDLVDDDDYEFLVGFWMVNNYG